MYSTLPEAAPEGPVLDLDPPTDPMPTRRRLFDVIGRPVRRPGSVLLTLAVTWLTLLLLVTVFADALPLKGYDVPFALPRQRPRFSWNEPLGTDAIGRSNLSRIVFGSRASLTVGFASVLISLVIGLLLGLLAGYYRGRTERVISLITDSMLAFPPLILLMAITATLGTNLPNLVAALAVVTVPTFARVARANTLVYSSREFVLAAKGLGARSRRILFREVLGNVLFPVVSYAFLVVAVIMVAEGSLSFLGLGIPPPQPSWGGMIAFGKSDFETDPFLVFVPVCVMFLTVFSLNVIGDRARSRFAGGRNTEAGRKR